MKRPVETLTPSEVDQLIRQCSPRCPSGIRNRALLATLYASGLRISEALNLYPKDLDPTNGTLRVLHGKGDKARVVAMNPAAFALVERWMERRASLGINGRNPVFCTLKGERIETAYIRQLLPRLGEKAGIEKRVHAHGLRHTYASELRQENVDIGIISRALGHSSIATTARYIDHITNQSVVEMTRAREWKLTV